MTEPAKAVVPFVEGKGLVPQDFDGMYRMASVMAASGLMPKGLQRPESAFIALQLGFELGMTPMQSVQNIAVINGRPTVWGDTMLALVQASGLLEDIDEREIGEGDSLRYECIIRRKGREKPIARSFSLKRAKSAGLLSKDSWAKYPERMCQMRARSWALRDGFPDVLKGIRSPADVDDGDMVDVTPAATTDTIVGPVTKTSEGPVSETQPNYGGEPQTAAGVVDTETPVSTGPAGEYVDAKEALEQGLKNGEMGQLDTNPPPAQQEEAPKVLGKDHPWYRDNWINKRPGQPPKTGFYKYVVENMDTWHEAPAGIQDAVRTKYAKSYGDDWPFPMDPEPDEGDEMEDAILASKEDPPQESASGVSVPLHWGGETVNVVAYLKRVEEMPNKGLLIQRLDEYVEFAGGDHETACKLSLSAWESWLKQVERGFGPADEPEDPPAKKENIGGRPPYTARNSADFNRGDNPNELKSLRAQVAQLHKSDQHFNAALTNLRRQGKVNGGMTAEYTVEECQAILKEIDEMRKLAQMYPEM